MSSKSLTTIEAAGYLTERGLRMSKSLLEKLRTRGPDDPRDLGPDFRRDLTSQTCWYSVADLDAYLVARLAARKLRAPAAQPERLRRGRGEHAA
jgi:hypothetical protein